MEKPRYIDANKIRLLALGSKDYDGDVLVSLRDVQNAIAQTPTEDVLEVVRCKDCINLGEPLGYEHYVCKSVYGTRWCKKDGFCRSGKRKEK